MKDNFNLKKFLTENKTIENSNPFLKEAKESKEKFNKSKLEKAIKAVLKKEGGAAGLKPLVDAAKKLGAEKKDLMGILKKMSSVEKHRHGDYILKENLQSKIREMIINELSPNIEDEEHSYLDYDEIEDKGDDMSITARLGLDKTDDFLIDEPLEEAKEDEPEEDVETEETEEDVETEETEKDVDIDSEGGLEDLAADVEGDEGDLMNNLMGALKIAKGMNNEKLTTQIGNTLKFFISEFISDKE